MLQRLLTFCFLLLLAGAATAVGLAWFYAGIAHPAIEENRLSDWSERRVSRGNGWRVRQWIGPGKHALLLRPLADWRPSVGANLIKWDPLEVPRWSAARSAAGDDAVALFEDARGWPLLSLRCTWRESPHRFFAPNEQVEGGRAIRPFAPDWMIRYDPSMGVVSPNPGYVSIEDRRALPLIPIWTGLIGSTLVLAAGWTPIVFLLSAPGALRRIIRKRRARCIRCGYRLTGLQSNVCPECGWRIGRRFPLVTGGRIAAASGLALVLLGGTGVLGAVLMNRYEGPRPIHAAARHGDLDRLERLLRSGAVVDEPVKGDTGKYYFVQGTTPLMWAAARGQIEAMKLLIAHSADVNARDDNNATALMFAAEYGHPAGVGLLLDAGADVSIVHSWGYTAIFKAAQSDRPGSLELLLKAGAAFDRTHTSGWKFTPLTAAAMHGRLENMRLLIEAGASVNPPIAQPPLYRAVEAGRVAAVTLLLKAGASTGEDAGPLLRVAADNNRTKIARLLIAAGTDPNHAHPSWGRTPLRSAVIRSNAELARLLVEAGADPNTVDEQGKTLLFHLDCCEAPPQLIDLVFSLGINVNHRSNDGNTALIQAVHQRCVEGVRRLLEAGGDPTIRNNSGQSALDHAEAALPYLDDGIRWGGNEVNPAIVAMLRTAVEGDEQ